MKIKLINIDCIQWLRERESESVDIIITSPPYNLKNKGGDYLIDSYKDNVDNELYEKQQLEFLNECYRVLKPTGALFYNHKNRYEKGQVITPYSWILKSKLKLNQEIIWNRITCVDYNKSKFAPLDEKIFWLYKDKTYKLKTGATKFTNIWEINRPKPSENMGHKATFPYKLIYRIINSLDMNYESSTILDPYLGSGTTLQVAKNFNFKVGIGIELENKWLEQAKIKINIKNDFIEELPKVDNPYKNGKYREQKLNKTQFKNIQGGNNE